MTPEERLAGKRVEFNELGAIGDPDGGYISVEDAVDAIREAEAAMRERCLAAAKAILDEEETLAEKVADSYRKLGYLVNVGKVGRIVEAIRNLP